MDDAQLYKNSIATTILKTSEMMCHRRDDLEFLNRVGTAGLLERFIQADMAHYLVNTERFKICTKIKIDEELHARVTTASITVLSQAEIAAILQEIKYYRKQLGLDVENG